MWSSNALPQKCSGFIRVNSLQWRLIQGSRTEWSRGTNRTETWNGLMRANGCVCVRVVVGLLAKWLCLAEVLVVCSAWLFRKNVQGDFKNSERKKSANWEMFAPKILALKHENSKFNLRRLIFRPPPPLPRHSAHRPLRMRLASARLCSEKVGESLIDTAQFGKGWCSRWCLEIPMNLERLEGSPKGPLIECSCWRSGRTRNGLYLLHVMSLRGTPGHPRLRILDA